MKNFKDFRKVGFNLAFGVAVGTYVGTLVNGFIQGVLEHVVGEKSNGEDKPTENKVEDQKESSGN